MSVSVDADFGADAVEQSRRPQVRHGGKVVEQATIERRSGALDECLSDEIFGVRVVVQLARQRDDDGELRRLDHGLNRRRALERRDRLAFADRNPRAA